MDADKILRGPGVSAPSIGRRRFTPTIYWKDSGEAHYLAFTTPCDQMPLVLIHNFVETPNGKRTFVCRKYPAFLDESGGECYICDYLEHQATFKRLACAFELDPIEELKGGRKVVKELVVQTNEVETDEGIKSYPRSGIIMQADRNFFGQIFTYDQEQNPITDVSVKVIKQGVKASVRYDMLFYPQRPDLSEHEAFMPNVDDWIAEYGSEQRYAEELAGAEPIKDESVPNDPSPQKDFADLKARLMARTAK